MLFVLAFLALFGNSYQMQMKYEHCKELKFEGKHCELQKKLSKFEK